MKVLAIEIAEAIEKEIATFLKDWGGGYAMRFTRFIDLGGKQTDLYLYPPKAGASPWCVIRIRSVFKSDQGECMQYFVNLPATGMNLDDVLVSPEIWKLPKLTDRILKFLKADLLIKVNEGSGALEGGGLALESDASLPSGPAESSQTEEEEDEDVDTSGILAPDGGGEEESAFDPMDIIAAAQANADGGDSAADFDPESVIQQANQESGEEESTGVERSEEAASDEESSEEPASSEEAAEDESSEESADEAASEQPASEEPAEAAVKEESGGDESNDESGGETPGDDASAEESGFNPEDVIKE